MNQEVIRNLEIIGSHWVAVVSILPKLLRKYSGLFDPVEVREMFRVHADFMESINDLNPGKIDWGSWPILRMRTKSTEHIGPHQEKQDFSRGIMFGITSLRNI